MTPGAVLLLDHWAAHSGFRQLTFREAAKQLNALLPGYPQPSDQPVAICVNGYRWFGSEMEAVADAVRRATRRTASLGENLAGSDWDVELNEEGLWSVPGRCLGRSRNHHARDCSVAARPAVSPS